MDMSGYRPGERSECGTAARSDEGPENTLTKTFLLTGSRERI